MPSTQDDGSTNRTPVNREILCRTCKEIECHMSSKRGNQHKVNSKWISCDLCSEWYHGMCQDLQNSDIAFLDKNEEKGIKWFCNTCCPQINAAAKGNNENSLGGLAAVAANSAATEKLSNIENMIKHMATASDNLEGRMEKLEKTYSEALQSNREGIKKSNEINSSARAILQQHHEANQQEARKNNVILYGVTEKSESTAL